MSGISVELLDAHRFRVRVREGESETEHEVRAPAEQVRRYGAGADAERLVEASFAFLLEREPASAILSRFELSVIERYFPEYPRVIRARLGGGPGGAG